MVTGASGFIGRAACSAFAKRGWQVRAAVRKPANIEGAQAVLGDLAQGWPLDGVDVIVHLAGIAHQIHAQNAESIYQEMNCNATERLARAAAHAGVKRFVFMSFPFARTMRRSPRIGTPDPSEMPSVPWRT